MRAKQQQDNIEALAIAYTYYVHSFPLVFLYSYLCKITESSNKLLKHGKFWIILSYCRTYCFNCTNNLLQRWQTSIERLFLKVWKKCLIISYRHIYKIQCDSITIQNCFRLLFDQILSCEFNLVFWMCISIAWFFEFFELVIVN